jgi:hypothetical protein
MITSNVKKYKNPYHLKKSRIKTKSTPLDPPCLKPQHRKLSVIWLEQQGKYIGLKIKKSGSYNSILPKGHLCFFLLSLP